LGTRRDTVRRRCPLEQEVILVQRAEVLDRDLEVGFAVAVDVALDDDPVALVFVTELALLVVELLRPSNWWADQCCG
jgi:hypothetical protein